MKSIAKSTAVSVCAAALIGNAAVAQVSDEVLKGRGKNKLSRILCLLWARVVKILPMTNPRKNRM